jgi:hypothetical protein
MKHIRRFLKWWKEHKDVAPFRWAAFLKAEGADGYFRPDGLYVDAPYAATGLARIYDGSIPGRERQPLAQLYARLKRSDLIDFLDALGVESRLEVSQTTIWSHPYQRELIRGFANTRSMGTAVDGSGEAGGDIIATNTPPTPTGAPGRTRLGTGTARSRAYPHAHEEAKGRRSVPHLPEETRGCSERHERDHRQDDVSP